MDIKNKKIILIIVICIWMGFIFYLSNQPSSVSTNQSGGFITMITNTPIAGNVLESILTSSIGEFVVRKAAHMFLYFVLAIFIFTYTIIELKKVNKKELRKRILLSLSIVFLYACTDEIHQLFIPGRSGEFRDVMVDTFGGVIGLIGVIIYYYKIIHKKHLL